jgi:hypothetical protein
VPPYTFLASLPAFLGFCGFIVYRLLGSHAKGEPVTHRIIDKLRREAPGAVDPDKRLAPAQVERLLQRRQDLQEVVGEQDFLLLQQALKQQFVVSLAVYALVILFCGLSAFLFVRQAQESKNLKVEGLSIADPDPRANHHLVDLDSLQALWHASGEQEDVLAYIENVQTKARSESVRVPSTQISVTFDRPSYRAILSGRGRGERNRIRFVLQARKAAFTSDVQDLEVGITVLTVLDSDARLTVAAMIDNSRVPFYDFEAKIVVPPRSLSQPFLSIGPRIPYQFRAISVRRPGRYDWNAAKGAYFGPDDPALVRFEFLIDHSIARALPESRGLPPKDLVVRSIRRTLFDDSRLLSGAIQQHVQIEMRMRPRAAELAQQKQPGLPSGKRVPVRVAGLKPET